jgi:hypothetical protein
VLDLLAAIPADYIGAALGVPIWASGWVRLARLLKVYRVYRLIWGLFSESQVSMALINLAIYFCGFVYLNHVAACFMFYIGKYQYLDHRNTRFDNRTWFTEFGTPPYHEYDSILDLPMIEQYIHSLYWAYATCGTVAYGDIIPVTITEKVYGFCVMILAKIFVAFIYAEAASVVSGFHASYTRHAQRKTTVKEWMEHSHLPTSL